MTRQDAAKKQGNGIRKLIPSADETAGKHICKGKVAKKKKARKVTKKEDAPANSPRKCGAGCNKWELHPCELAATSRV